MFGNQPHQHDEADLAVHVKRAARAIHMRQQQQRRQRAGHRQRHRQHNNKRRYKALKLRGQHQIDECQRQHENHQQLPTRFTILARFAVECGLHRLPEFFARGSFEKPYRFIQRVIRREARGQRCSAHAVKVIELLRRHGFF